MEESEGLPERDVDAGDDNDFASEKESEREAKVLDSMVQMQSLKSGLND